MAAKIKKGDTVVVIAGRDKGSKGEVLKVLVDENRVVVRGVNVPEDILRGQCVEVSEAAAECGIHIGMIGRVALERMKGLPATNTAGVGVGSKL